MLFEHIAGTSRQSEAEWKTVYSRLGFSELHCLLLLVCEVPNSRPEREVMSCMQASFWQGGCEWSQSEAVRGMSWHPWNLSFRHVLLCGKTHFLIYQQGNFTKYDYGDSTLIIFAKIHLMLISENEFFYDVKTWRNHKVHGFHDVGWNKVLGAHKSTASRSGCFSKTGKSAVDT